MTSLLVSARPTTGRFVAFKDMRIFAPLLLVLATAPLARGQAPSAPGGLSSVGIPFVANDGQTDTRVAYYAQTFAGTVFVTKEGRLVYSLPAEDRSAGWTLTEAPLTATSIRPAPMQRSNTKLSFFRGSDPAKWKADIDAYDGVSLGDVWPGVHVSLHAQARNVEKIFTVAPRANPSRIRMRVTGARSLRVDSTGALVAMTGLGPVTFTKPVAYQTSDGKRREIDVRYTVRGSAYGFRLGDYDASLPVVIDPLVQSTYWGADGDTSGYLGDEYVNAIAIRPSTGDVYVAGWTTSPDFPGTTGGFQPERAGDDNQYFDAYVARFHSSLTSLLQATFLGGTSTEVIQSMAINDVSGHVYVAGGTSSADFPGAQNEFGGVKDGFVAILNDSLTQMVRSVFIGGSALEDGLSSLVLHPSSGDLYVGGFTESDDMPGTAGGAQPARASIWSSDGYVARLTPELSILQATYLGGTSGEEFVELTIHPTTGDVYLSGQTGSADFPGLTGGALTTYPAFEGTPLFVARLDSALTSLLQSTYLHGTGSNYDGPQILGGIAVHPTTGDIYVAGATDTPVFPATAGGAQSTHASDSFTYDGFVSRLNSTLTTILQSTFFGGSHTNGDFIYDLEISPFTGEIYVTGSTKSSNLPGTSGGIQTVNLLTDVFVARFSSTLTTLNQATYLGGDQAEEGAVLAISPESGDVYVAGRSGSDALFPGMTGGAQETNAGRNDIFISRMTRNLASASEPNTCPNTVRATATSATSVTITWIAPSGFTPTKYHVYRSSNNSTWTQVNGETTTGLLYVDNTVAAGNAYLYKVRSVNASNNESTDSTRDLATTFVFTDPTITALSTLVKREHLVELRTAIDEVRKLANGGVANPFSYTDPSISTGSTPVRALHVSELRQALNQARTTIFNSSLTFTDPTIAATATAIRREHIVELRAGVQ